MSDYALKISVVICVLLLVALKAFPRKRRRQSYTPMTCEACGKPINDPEEVEVLGKGLSYHRSCLDEEYRPITRRKFQTVTNNTRN